MNFFPSKKDIYSTWITSHKNNTCYLSCTWTFNESNDLSNFQVQVISVIYSLWVIQQEHHIFYMGCEKPYLQISVEGSWHMAYTLELRSHAEVWSPIHYSCPPLLPANVYQILTTWQTLHWPNPIYSPSVPTMHLLVSSPSSKAVGFNSPPNPSVSLRAKEPLLNISNINGDGGRWGERGGV